MAYELTKYWWIVYINMSLGLFSLQYLVDGIQQVPCFFIFGDSLVDNGNNNNLFTLAKSNFPPYGIDFPAGRATGRFSNGRNMADFTAELLGFEDYIPPFADSNGANILLGINYASSGAGILNETGQSFGQHVSLDNQLQNHLITISRILNITRSSESTVKYLTKCFYYVGMGSNDYLNNFEPELFSTVPGKFANELMQQYSRQIKTLYNNGARKFGLYGIAAAGCTPYEIGKFGIDGHLCVEQLNSEVQIFNTKLKSLVDEFNDNYKNAKFIFVNIYDLTLEVVANPSSFGFRVINEACCGLGENKRLPCVPLEIPCQNRSEYLFWDAFHPSEAAHKIVADRSYRAQREGDTYPMDIFSLAQLQLED